MLTASWANCLVEAIAETFATELTLVVAGTRRAILRIESGREELAALELASGDTLGMSIGDDGGLLLSPTRSDAVYVLNADPDFEAWTLTFEDGEMFVCSPGGGVAHWASR